MNLQNMTLGRELIDASKPNIRAGIVDSVTALPAGVNGALVSAGGASGVNVATSMTRKANRIEKLFATVSETAGTVTANLLTLEGTLSFDDAQVVLEM
jgi:hypothetical protein